MNTRNDELLHKEIQYIISNEPSLKGCDINISVNDGYVTLSGSVDRLYKKISAGSLVIRLDGVSEFENRISIRPWQFVKNKEFEPVVSNFDEVENKMTTSGA
jgi:osmotically-inducible protein OsmY